MAVATDNGSRVLAARPTGVESERSYPALAELLDAESRPRVRITDFLTCAGVDPASRHAAQTSFA